MGKISQKHIARQCRDALKACEAEGKELSTTRKYVFEVGSNSHLYSADGTAPLIAFLSSVAIEVWLRVADDDEELDDEAIDNEFMVLLSKAKQDIVTGKLAVQRARSQVRVNDDPDIISGCSASDNATLFDANLVVRKDDAIAWLKGIGAYIPNGLVSNDAASHASPNSKGDWKSWVRDLGIKFKNQYTRLSQKQIAERIRKQMEIEGISGRGGRIPSAETIVRDALTGI